MDLTKRDVREIAMSKKPNKEKLLDKVNDEKPVKSKNTNITNSYYRFFSCCFWSIHALCNDTYARYKQNRNIDC